MKITLKGNPVTLWSEPTIVGDKVSLTLTDLNLQDVKLEKFNKKLTVFSVFPSINTRVCDLQTKYLNELADQYSDIDFISVSLDLPTALKDWFEANQIEKDNMKVYSDYKKKQLGKRYGFLINEVVLLNRGVFVVDSQGIILYIEHNKEVSDSIDFDKLEAFLKTQK